MSFFEQFTLADWVALGGSTFLILVFILFVRMISASVAKQMRIGDVDNGEQLPPSDPLDTDQAQALAQAERAAESQVPAAEPAPAPKPQLKAVPQPDKKEEAPSPLPEKEKTAPPTPKEKPAKPALKIIEKPVEREKAEPVKVKEVQEVEQEKVRIHEIPPPEEKPEIRPPAKEKEIAPPEVEKKELPPPEKKKSLKEGLAKTRKGFIGRINDILFRKKEIDSGTVEDLEEVLYTADIGVSTATKLLELARDRLEKKQLSDPGAIQTAIREEILGMLDIETPPLKLDDNRPFTIMVVGVNGVGKTTTIGKLAAGFTGEGKKVVLGAGDTFRAAAVEQLEIWGDRSKSEVVKGKEAADPASVIFDTIKHAQSVGADVVIADTAGRLHTKVNLMEELKKVSRVMGKAVEGAPHETWLVLDATTGQNALQQARQFSEALGGLSGIVLTKLDGTAKGGIIVGICHELKIPIRYIGIGEKVVDLRPFDPQEFVEALFSGD